MTQDEIIELAVQAGTLRVIAELNVEILQAFAKLVAAKEREAIRDICKEEQGQDSADLWNVCIQHIIDKIDERQ